MSRYIARAPYRRSRAGLPFWASPRGRRQFRNWTVRPEHFNGGRRMPVEVRADDESYIIRALVPGASPDEIQIEVLEDLVTLKANQAEQAEPELEGEPLMSEIAGPSGAYRRIRLPESVEAEQVEAKLENGLLTVRLPKSEARRTKRIEVTAK